MLSRIEGWLCVFFLSVGVGLLALAANLYFAPPARPALDPGATDIEITNAVALEERAVTITLHNSSGKAMRVLGLTFC